MTANRDAKKIVVEEPLVPKSAVPVKKGGEQENITTVSGLTDEKLIQKTNNDKPEVDILTASLQQNPVPFQQGKVDPSSQKKDSVAEKKAAGKDPYRESFM